MAHVNVGKVHPDAYKATVELNKRVVEAATSAGLDEELVELVKIRVSQLNGCAFCLKMHTTDAIAHGETWDRLAVLPAWWESQYFTDTERAALNLAERVTLISDDTSVANRGVTPEDHLNDEQISAVTWLAVVMNAWNRIAITSHYPVAPKA